MTRIVYHWFRGVQLHVIRSKSILYYRNTTWCIRNAYFLFFKFEFLMKWETDVILVKSAPVLSTRRTRLCDTLCQFLTHNMLNCFKDYKRCIHIPYHILDFVQQNRFTMEQPYMLLILYCQYHSCNLGSQGINRNGIDQISRNIPSLASKELSCLY